MQLQASSWLSPRLWAALGGQGWTLHPLLQGRAVQEGSHGRGPPTLGRHCRREKAAVTLGREISSPPALPCLKQAAKSSCPHNTAPRGPAAQGGRAGEAEIRQLSWALCCAIGAAQPGTSSPGEPLVQHHGGSQTRFFVFLKIWLMGRSHGAPRLGWGSLRGRATRHGAA